MKNAKYRQTGMYDATNIDTDILLIPFNGNDMSKKAIYLNEISALIFTYISDGKTILQIIDILVERYDVERSKLEIDVSGCVEKLISLNAITLEELLE